MFDTLAVIAYILSSDTGHFSHIRLSAKFKESEKPVCSLLSDSPQLSWTGVPPDATSLAVIIKDKQHYYWVAYNLPSQITQLPFASDTTMRARDEGINSWKQNRYHTICSNVKTMQPVTVEIYALDKNFNATRPMTGEILEQKIKGHVLAKGILRS